MTFPFDTNANEVEPADRERRWTDGAPFATVTHSINTRAAEAKRFIREHDDLELYLHELNRHEYWGVREANGLNTEFLSIREVAYALIAKGENPNEVRLVL